MDVINCKSNKYIFKKEAQNNTFSSNILSVLIQKVSIKLNS
jgi:hypothetical protein